MDDEQKNILDRFRPVYLQCLKHDVVHSFSSRCPICEQEENDPMYKATKMKKAHARYHFKRAFHLLRELRRWEDVKALAEDEHNGFLLHKAVPSIKDIKLFLRLINPVIVAKAQKAVDDGVHVDQYEYFGWLSKHIEGDDEDGTEWIKLHTRFKRLKRNQLKITFNGVEITPNHIAEVDKMVECKHRWYLSSSDRYSMFYRCAECGALDAVARAWRDEPEVLRHRQWVNAQGEDMESVLWQNGNERYATHRVLDDGAWVSNEDIPF